MQFSVVGLPHYTIWHLYEPSVDDLHHMEEMEKERKEKEAEEKAERERMEKIKAQFDDPADQWNKDKSDIRDAAKKEYLGKEAKKPIAVKNDVTEDEDDVEVESSKKATGNKGSKKTDVDYEDLVVKDASKKQPIQKGSPKKQPVQKDSAEQDLAEEEDSNRKPPKGKSVKAKAPKGKLSDEKASREK